MTPKCGLSNSRRVASMLVRRSNSKTEKYDRRWGGGAISGFLVLIDAAQSLLKPMRSACDFLVHYFYLQPQRVRYIFPGDGSMSKLMLNRLIGCAMYIPEFLLRNWSASSKMTECGRKEV